MREESASEIAENFFFVPDEFDHHSGLWPVRFGSNTAKQGYNVGPRSIPYYSLHFVRNGQVKFDYGTGTVQLVEGGFFCMLPGHSYSYRMLPHAHPLQMTWIAFDGPQANRLLSWLNIGSGTPFKQKKPAPELQLTLEQLLRSARGQHPSYKLKRYTLLYRLFEQLCETPAQEEPELTRGPNEWIPKSIEYMKMHYGEPIGVKHVSDHIGVHRAHFSKLFTEQTGINPSDYLRRLRMDQALRLLQHTSRSVLDISLSLGYADATSFTRAFGQYYGRSPRQARLDYDGANGSNA